MTCIDGIDFTSTLCHNSIHVAVDSNEFFLLCSIKMFQERRKGTIKRGKKRIDDV